MCYESSVHDTLAAAHVSKSYGHKKDEIQFKGKYFTLTVCTDLYFYRDASADGSPAAAEVYPVSHIRTPHRSVANRSEIG
jgi:hypothetical protein